MALYLPFSLFLFLFLLLSLRLSSHERRRAARFSRGQPATKCVLKRTRGAIPLFPTAVLLSFSRYIYFFLFFFSFIFSNILSYPLFRSRSFRFDLFNRSLGGDRTNGFKSSSPRFSSHYILRRFSILTFTFLVYQNLTDSLLPVESPQRIRDERSPLLQEFSPSLHHKIF